MGVLGLHNECPPMNYGPAEAQEVSRGLLMGEAATSATLRAISDTIQTLAYMDDTVANAVSAWSHFDQGGTVDPAALQASARTVQESYNKAFDAISQTTEQINFAIRKYRELQAYAADALDEGRGSRYEKALVELGEDGFGSMVDHRIERLRTLKVRVEVLRKLQGFGAECMANNNFPDFFQLLMQPIRDLSIASNDLYSEVVRGALVSHSAFHQVCHLAGEELATEAVNDFVEAVAMGAYASNGDGEPCDNC